MSNLSSLQHRARGILATTSLPDEVNALLQDLLAVEPDHPPVPDVQALDAIIELAKQYPTYKDIKTYFKAVFEKLGLTLLVDEISAHLLNPDYRSQKTAQVYQWTLFSKGGSVYSELIAEPQIPEQWWHTLNQYQMIHNSSEGSPVPLRGIKSYIVVPLSHTDHLQGVLQLLDRRQERQWSQEILRAVRCVAFVLELAILYFETLHNFQQSHTRLEMLTESVHDGFCDWNLRTQHLYISPRWAKLYGCEDDQFPAHLGLERFFQQVHPDDLSRVQPMITDFLASQESRLHLECRIKYAQGSYIWIDLNVFVIRDVEGAVVRLLATQRDVTSVQRLQEAEHYQRMMLQNLYETFAILNATLNMDEITNSVLMQLSRFVPHDLAVLVMVDEEDCSSIRYNIPVLMDGLQELVISPPRPYEEVTLFRQMMPVPKPLMKARLPLSDATLDGILSEEMITVLREGSPDTCSYLGIPIQINRRTLFFLNIFSRWEGIYGDVHLARLTIFVDQAIVALDKAHLYRKSREVGMNEERHRIASELHDVVSQTLFSANMIAEILPRILQKDQALGERYIGNLHQLTQTALAEMRSMLVELRPESFSKVALDDLLEQLCNNLARRLQVTPAFQVIGEPRRLPGDVRLVFYRITQEALNNINKHAHATEIKVILQYTEKQVGLMIKDNGTGFVVADVPPEHFGIEIMQERAKKINAYFNLHSGINQGTEIRLIWHDPVNLTKPPNTTS